MRLKDLGRTRRGITGVSSTRLRVSLIAPTNKKNTVLAKAKELKLVDDKVMITDFPGKLAMRVQSGPTNTLTELKKEVCAS